MVSAARSPHTVSGNGWESGEGKFRNWGVQRSRVESHRWECCAEVSVSQSPKESQTPPEGLPEAEGLLLTAGTLLWGWTELAQVSVP